MNGNLKRISSWMMACLTATLVACGPEDLTDPAQDTGQATSALGTALKITSANLTNLKSTCWYNGYLKWYTCSGSDGGQKLDAPYKFSYPAGGTTATQLADMYNNNPGQCVSMVKALSHSIVNTSNWIRGNKVVNGGVAIGTAIATFGGTNNTFRLTGADHTGFFRGYLTDVAGAVIGIYIWDQNIGSPTVQRRTIMINGSATKIYDNAANFYVVNVP